MEIRNDWISENKEHPSTASVTVGMIMIFIRIQERSSYSGLRLYSGGASGRSFVGV